MRLTAYVQWNEEQWHILIAMLAQGQSATPSGMVGSQRSPEQQQRPPSAIPYPFRELLFDLREELPDAREAAAAPSRSVSGMASPPSSHGPVVSGSGWIKLRQGETKDARLDRVTELVQGIVQECAGEHIDADSPIAAAAVDSLAAVEIISR